MLESKALGWMIKNQDSCNCEWIRKKMNALGCTGCERRFDEVLGWVKESAAKAKLLVPKFIAGMALPPLIRTAIRRARAKMAGNPPPGG